MHSARRGASPCCWAAWLDCKVMPVHRKPPSLEAQADRWRKETPRTDISVRGVQNCAMPVLVLLLFIDVVADYAAEYRSGCATDDCTLHLVPAGDGADDCTSAGADGGVTL